MDDDVKKNTILVVDDTSENIDVLRGVLGDDYRIKIALSGDKALKIAGAGDQPDLILLDIMMPDMDGYEVCRRLKENPLTRRIPVIFITAKSEVEDETRGFGLGAVDYITKPISPPVVKARVKTHIELRNSRTHVEQLLTKTLMGSVKLLTDMLAIANPEVFSQSSRLKRYAHDIAVYLNLTDCWRFEIAALLSQVGYVVIPKVILEKISHEKTLSPAEREQLTSLPGLARDLLGNIPRLEQAAAMIGRQQETLSQPMLAGDIHNLDMDVLGGQILRVILDFDRHIMNRKTVRSAIIELKNTGLYHPALVDALRITQGEEKDTSVEKTVKLDELQIGMILQEHIFGEDDSIIVERGSEISNNIINLLKRYTTYVKIKEPIYVLIRKRSSEG